MGLFKPLGQHSGDHLPLFSFFWAALGAAYYFLVHPYILNALAWLSNNLAFSFFIGMFFGVFIIDVVHSSQIIVKLKKFAEENKVVVKYESIRTTSGISTRMPLPSITFSPFRSDSPLAEHLKNVSQAGKAERQPEMILLAERR